MATILIVDDELMIQQMIAAVVEDMGHEALTAADGRAALSLLEATSRPPALVISDLMMPHLNGFELARTLKSNPRYERIPFVLMSAACHTRPAAPADEFLAKPFELNQIEQSVEHFVGDGVCAPADSRLYHQLEAALLQSGG
jgi:two-component system sensor histidine kinase/response regulator